MIRRAFQIVLALLFLAPAAACAQEKPAAASRPDPAKDLRRSHQALQESPGLYRKNPRQDLHADHPDTRLSPPPSTSSSPTAFISKRRALRRSPATAASSTPCNSIPEKIGLPIRKARVWARRRRISTGWSPSTPKARSGITWCGWEVPPGGSSRWSTSPSTEPRGW